MRREHWEEQQPTWKNPGGMGPPGIPSFGGMFPSTGLGAAAALCGEQNQGKHGQSYDKSMFKTPPLLPHHTESICLVSFSGAMSIFPPVEELEEDAHSWRGTGLCDSSMEEMAT